LEWYVKGLAAKGALRLRESNLWKSARHGHSNILATIGKEAGRVRFGLLNQPTDYLVARMNFEKNTDVCIPNIEEWDKNVVIKEQETAVFTDASVSEKGTGVGIFSKELNIKKSIRLKDGCSILQAELYAIKEAARLIGEKGRPTGPVTIYTDSQTALRSIETRKVRSKLVMNCQEALSWLRESKVKLCWVPGHRNVEGNEEADKLAKLASTRDNVAAEDSPLPQLKSQKEIIDEIILEKQKSEWRNREDCIISRRLWPEVNKEKSRRLLELCKSSIRTATGVVTGNCPVGVNLVRWKISKDDYCRECNEEEETVEHLLCRCPSLREQRFQKLGQYYIEELEEISDTDIKKLASFAGSWKCFKAKE
jgi:ribonuclease HI